MTDDKKLEEVFRKEAATNMIQFDLHEFKKSHPRLFKTITSAMKKWAAIEAGKQSTAPKSDNKSLS